VFGAWAVVQDLHALVQVLLDPPRAQINARAAVQVLQFEPLLLWPIQLGHFNRGAWLRRMICWPQRSRVHGHIHTGYQEGFLSGM